MFASYDGPLQSLRDVESRTWTVGGGFWSSSSGFFRVLVAHSAVAFVGPLSTGGENSLASDLRFHHRRSASPCLLRSLSSKSLTRFRSMGQAVHAWKLGALDHESRLSEARIRKRQLQSVDGFSQKLKPKERQKSSLL